MFVSGFCFGSLTPPCPPLRGGNLPDEGTLHICGSASLRAFPLCKGVQKNPRRSLLALPWIAHTRKFGVENYPPPCYIIDYQ